MGDRRQARHHHHLDRRRRAHRLLAAAGCACALVAAWQALELHWSRVLPGDQWARATCPACHGTGLDTHDMDGLPRGKCHRCA